MKSTSIGKLEFQECKLKKVMVVPEISANLLSVREITKHGGEIIFTGNEVIISKKGIEILKGEASREGQYRINFQ